ncbi:DNA methyltransferase Dim-2, partial [Ascosphaera aggregata]
MPDYTMQHDLDLLLNDSADELLLDNQDLDTKLVREKASQTDVVSEVKAEELSVRDFKEESSPSQGPRLSHISPPPLIYPQSAYGVRPQSIVREGQVIDLLKLEQPNAFEDGEIELDQFVVYAETELRYGMVSLDQVVVKVGRGPFYFDGQVKIGKEAYYLEHVPFSLVSIGGYENFEQHSVDDSLWIQSAANERLKNGLWYRLKHPTKEYKSYHELFAWVAGLAKHVLDYLYDHENICLENFRADFVSWLISTHGADGAFRCWLNKHPSADFRHVIVAHADFLQKQALDMDAQSDAGLSYENHLLWHEINPLQSPNLVMKEQPREVKDTIVTPYVKECFHQMEWEHFLRAMKPRAEVLEARNARCKAMGFDLMPKGITPQVESIYGCNSYNSINIGDVVAVPRDEKTKWKKDEDMLWYAVVQDIKPLKRDARLFVIWLYKPSETICADLNYLKDHELFLSNH